MKNLLIYIFLFLFISTPLVSEGVSNYFPNKSGVFGDHLSIVKDLRENILSSTKTSRGTGSDVYRDLVYATVKIRTHAAEGSGILIDNNGHVVTNYHVIQRGDTVSRNIMLAFCRLGLTDFKDAYFYETTVIKYDKTRDLALLKINSPLNDKNIKIAPLETDESDIVIGMKAHAIGHPFGLSCHYTDGVVSQYIENYKWGAYDPGETEHEATVIATQTVINPGNSGGPLANDNGKVIGMNTFGHPEALGINFAVAAVEINDFVDNYPINKILPPDDPDEGNGKGNWITRKSDNDWITKKSEESKKSKICTLDEPLYKEDSNNNGVDDYFEYDGNCNNIPDIIKYDDDEDGKHEKIFIDKNENKLFELFISFDLHEEGRFEGKLFAIYLYDEDENGEYEEVCFDVDLDEKIDQCRAIS